MSIHISDHAVLRYQERVAPLAPKAIRAEIRTHAPAIEKAADFGCDTVICASYRIKLKGRTVATVLEKRGY